MQHPCLASQHHRTRTTATADATAISHFPPPPPPCLVLAAAFLDHTQSSTSSVSPLSPTSRSTSSSTAQPLLSTSTDATPTHPFNRSTSVPLSAPPHHQARATTNIPPSVSPAGTAETIESTATLANKPTAALSCDPCMAESSASQQSSSPHRHASAAPLSPANEPEFDIVHHPIKDTLLIVSSLLSLMVHKNDSQYNPLVDPVTLFHSRAVPRISIESYLARILQFIPFTNEVLLNVLVLLDRIGGLSGMEMTLSGRVEFGQPKQAGESSERLFGNTAAPALPPVTVPSASTAPAVTSPSTSSPTSSSRSSQSWASVSISTPCSASKSYELSPSFSSSPSSRSSPQIPWVARSSYSSAHPSTCSSASYSSPKKILRDSRSSANLNSDSPMVQKRAREEAEGKEVGGPDVFGDQPQQYHPHSQQEQSQPPLLQHEGDRDPPRISKKPRLEQGPSSPTMSAPSIAPAAQYTQHASATIDAHAPGGSTPAPTPKLTVAPNGFRINSFNIHRLLITCLMVAAKFTSDLFYSNARYAKVGGLSLLELNQLELEFLFTTRFELNVKVEELQKVGNALLRFKNHEMIPEQPAQSLQNKHQAPLHGPQMRTPIIVAANGHHSNVTTTATSEVTGHGGQSQQAKAGRFSIPSPTSPRNGPMSDRAVLSATLCSSSASSTTTTSALVSTAIASSDSVGNAHGATAVVASEASLQRPQLLSPPEEKHTWAETEVQMTEERIDQAQDQKEASGSASSSTDSALSSDPSSSSSPS